MAEEDRQTDDNESGFYGRYKLVERIAAGGMAEVYKAKVEMFGGVEKVVVVKRILPQFNGDPEFIKMFEDEAKISSGLQHVNLVQVFDYGNLDGSYFLAMEYIEGADLQSVLRECHFRRIPIPMELSVLLVAEVLRGLDYAHRKIDPSTGKKMGIVHRDISPANIMISYDGNVKLMDFGIAKAKTKSSTTQIGTLKGKYSYMSPEQARGEDVDFRSDIFSCGIICYELVTGVRPFRGKSELEILERVKSARYDPPKAVNPHIPQRLSDIIETALQQNREKRFQETGVFCDKLTAVLAEFDNRPDSSALTKFLRKVFAEDGKKNRTDLSAIMEKAVESKSEPVKSGTERVPAGKSHAARKASDSIGPAPIAEVTADDDEVDVEAASEDLPPIDFAVACLRFAASDGEDAEQRLREFLAEVETEVTNKGGRVERRTAAGLIAYFDTDASQVDHRLRALETARKVADLGRRPGSELQLTVGVCAGVVRRDVTQASVKALAQAIKRSERLAARADGVGVLVDEEISQHAGDGFVMRRVGESDGMPAFAPIRAAKREADRPTRDRPSRGQSVGTVGRDEERKILIGKLEEVVAGQGARAVAITGPVGIGKSHLVHDLVRSAAGRGANVFIGRCVAAGRHVAFSVYQDLMRDILGLPDGAGKEATTQRLEKVISELNLAPSLPQVLKPLYAGARQITTDEVARMGAALRDILAALSAGSKALVLVVEDLHWGDDPSKAVTAALVDYLRRERVLVIVTQRSDVKDPWLSQRRAVEQVELGPLDDEAILRIAMDRLQLPQLSKELGDFLKQRARGNPFYLLESVRNLSEKGLGGSAVATNRQTLTAQSELYSPVIAKPKVLSDRQQQRVDRVKSAVAPQIRGFADDFRRAGAFVQPTVHAFLDWVVGLFGFAKKVKKAYDPKTAESLTKDE